METFRVPDVRGESRRGMWTNYVRRAVAVGTHGAARSKNAIGEPHMNSDYIKDSLMIANHIALTGVEAGREIAHRESRFRIARLESEVLRLRELLREHGIEVPDGVEVST